jgi:acyl-CoA reductase-like NAD-dependent aldehyde dehydrogenase
MRKLLVRRSDLDWMLRDIEAQRVRRQVDALESHVDQPPELGAIGRVTTDSSAERPVDHEMIMFTLKKLSEADEDLAAARAASENAPPNPDFGHRMRELAHGFMSQSDALARAASMDGGRHQLEPRPAAAAATADLPRVAARRQSTRTTPPLGGIRSRR